MRCENIKVHFDIPVRVNSNGSDPFHAEKCFIDGNGVVYEISAIADACNGAVGAPIIQYNSKGQPVPIGVVEEVKWNPAVGRIEVDGRVLHGGTSEEVVFSSAKDVVSMEIQSFGFSE